MEVGGEIHAPVALSRGNRFRFPSLGRFHGRFGVVEKSLLSPPIIQASAVRLILRQTVDRSMASELKRVKGKAVPLQARSGPEGSRKLRFPDFVTTAQDGGKVVSLTNRPPLPPGNAPGTHFCYRLSGPQGHSAIGRILYQCKIQCYQLGSKQRPSDL